MYCTWLAGNTRRKNYAKIAICGQLHKVVGLYLRNWGIYRQSEKNLLNSNICSICTHNTVNFGPLRSVGEFGTPQQISTGFASWVCYCTDVSQQRSTSLHDVWPSPWLVHRKYRTQKSRHLCTIAQICRAISSQRRHVSTFGKKCVKQRYVLHMSP